MAVGWRRSVKEGDGRISVAFPGKFMGGHLTSTCVQLHKLVAYASPLLAVSLSLFR